MRKKILGIVTMISFLPMAMSASSPYKKETADITSATSEYSSAEVSSSIEASSVEEEYLCHVKISECQYGDVLVDINDGNVGDIVTVYAKAYTLCRVVSIDVNGTALIANEDGNYTFSLVEGDNIITAKFEVDSEQLKTVADFIINAKAGDWNSIFTMENLITVISWVVTTLLSSGFFITLLKYKKIKTKTTEDVAKVAQDAIDNGCATAINNFLMETFSPVFDKLNEHLVNTDEVCKTLARCFILAQSDTPESRLAIVNELTKLQGISKELAEQVSAIIGKEIAKNEEVKNAKKQAVEELEQANENIETNEKQQQNDDNIKEEGTDDNYGQI